MGSDAVLRSGQFDNLQWDKLAEAHSADWELLQTRYNLLLQQTPPAASLDTLAAQSVKTCHSFFFTKADHKDSQQPLATDTLPVDDLVQYFSPALCDHLIVTFAYRFLCDNLVPMEQSACLNAIYDCRTESTIKAYKPGKKGQQVRDADEENKWKRNFSRSKRRTCAGYTEKIDAFFTLYESLLTSICEDESNQAKPKRVEKMGQYALVRPAQFDRRQGIRADLAILDEEKAAAIAERYQAPHWIFSIFMACNRFSSPFAVKDGNLAFANEFTNGGDLLYKLSRFLGNSERGSLLLGEAEPKSKRIIYSAFAPVEFTAEMERLRLELPTSLAELRQSSDGNLFVAVPYVNDGTYRHSLPPQSYKMIGTSDSCKIPGEVQQMFNSYLVERTFHGYASATIMDQIKARDCSGMFRGHRDQYQKLPAIVRLRAPLVHPALIRLADKIVHAAQPSEAIIPWLDSFVDDWNQMSLPLLEECFVRSVWDSYKGRSVEEVLSEIMKALTQGEKESRRYNRLNLYRLIQTKDDAPAPEKDDVRNEVMKNTFLAGLGCKIGQTDGRWIDPGRAVAFGGSLRGGEPGFLPEKPKNSRLSGCFLSQNVSIFWIGFARARSKM